jgi:hypothetical protein
MPSPKPLPLPARPTGTARDRATLLDIPTVAATLSLGKSSVYDLIQRGALRTVLIKGKHRVRLTDLIAYVDRL